KSQVALHEHGYGTGYTPTVHPRRAQVRTQDSDAPQSAVRVPHRAGKRAAFLAALWRGLAARPRGQLFFWDRRRRIPCCSLTVRTNTHSAFAWDPHLPTAQTLKSRKNDLYVHLPYTYRKTKIKKQVRGGRAPRVRSPGGLGRVRVVGWEWSG